jgi:hypothetical protein
VEQASSAFLAGMVLSAAVLIFAIVFALLLGRFVTGDDDGYGFALRAVFLLLCALTAISLFRYTISSPGDFRGAVACWLMVPLALLPLIELRPGGGLTGLWLKHRRQARLGDAVTAAAEKPDSPFPRVHLGRALLECGYFAPGLAALEEALARTDAGSDRIIRELVEETRNEFVRPCPACRHPVPHTALACGKCHTAFRGGAMVTWLLRATHPRGR